MQFQVIEDRGYNILYPVFQGTLSRCLKFVNAQDYEQWLESNLPLWQRCLHNGDGSPFDFRIEVLVEDFEFES